MTVRQIVEIERTSRAVVEVSPQKILYEVLDTPSDPDFTYAAAGRVLGRYQLPLPWIYIIFANKSPYHILGAHEPLTSVDSPLGALPLLGSRPSITCFAYVAGARSHYDLLSQTASVINSGGLASYMEYFGPIPAWEWFGGRSFDELYSAWEAYEEFPPACPLNHIAGLRAFGITELLKDPQVLAE